MKKNNLAIQNINGVRLNREDIDQAKEWDDLIGLWHNTTEVDRLAQWYKGDIAVRIGIIFGEDSLGQFAHEVGESRSAIDNYRRVARAFPPNKRDYNLPFYTFLAASLADSFDKGKKEFASEKRFEWVEKAEADFATARRELRVRKYTNLDAVCFHSQQCAEKYLKARLQEAGIPFGKTHNLLALLDLILEVEPLWSEFRPLLRVLNRFAVDFRYPGESADKEMAKQAYEYCRTIRGRVRQSLGLKP